MKNNFLEFRLINNLLLPSINYVSKKDLKKKRFFKYFIWNSFFNIYMYICSCSLSSDKTVYFTHSSSVC